MLERDITEEQVQKWYLANRFPEHHQEIIDKQIFDQIDKLVIEAIPSSYR